MQTNDHQDDAVWAGLFAPPGPSEELAEVWLDSLCCNEAAPVDLLLAILDAGSTTPLCGGDIPPAVLDAAVVHPDRQVWGRAAESGQLTPAQWDRLLTATAGRPGHVLAKELAADAAALASRPSWSRRIAVDRVPDAGTQPPSTPEEIAALAGTVPDIEPGARTYALWWVAALHDDADAMRQLATSPRLWIRRSVARARRLPPDVVERLARDEDFAVRLFLTESCDDAPAELLLRVWEEGWNGSFSFPGRPLNHPNFPLDGLLRFADDPRPRMRLLALHDPASTADLVERLAHDPDRTVRRHAAQHPRLSPTAAATLAADEDVAPHAHRHPALPLPLLAELLQDPFTAEDAAMNPALPVHVMRRMVAVAGAVRAG
ncbi:hypothetical protein [Kitasatospora sp. NPDC001527]|uniref:hypothetical protein n=1 Tax=Kitasatospora sp. NPDC001527 TaxID=3154519 RepID=UPI003318DA6B